MPCVLQLTLISGADFAVFEVQNVSSGMLVVSTLAPMGTIERSRSTWEHEHEKGDLGVQARMSKGFAWTSRPHFERCYVTLEHRV